MGHERPPVVFGKCVVERKIGEGGMGTVYLGRHQTLGIPVAIKVLPAYLNMKDRAFAQRFEREARLAAGLRHPNIVHVIDSGTEGGQRYLVMEYIDGPTCRQKVEAGNKLAWPEAVQVVRQVANALGYGVRKGIIHRDVKPDNIMIDSDGVPRITDLGLAKEVAVTPEKARLTRTGTSLGTPFYMSPEQINNAKDVDFRSDIYSLGITLYYLACGRVPYAGTAFEVMAKHVQAPLPSPKLHAPDLPDAVCDVIKKMTAKKPEHRYQSYEGLCEDLERTLRGEEVSAAGFGDESVVTGEAPASPNERASEEAAAGALQETVIVGPGGNRRKLIIYAIAVAIAVAATIAAILLR